MEDTTGWPWLTFWQLGGNGNRTNPLLIQAGHIIGSSESAIDP